MRKVMAVISTTANLMIKQKQYNYCTILHDDISEYVSIHAVVLQMDFVDFFSLKGHKRSQVLSYHHSWLIIEEIDH